MTDFEVLQRAKQYIDDLANGKDPISRAELPADTVLNNVRLARCFFYVSDVLQRVIDNGGEVGARKKPKKLPFAITRPEIDKVPLQDEPVYISYFCKAISAAAGAEEKNMQALSHRVVTDWLCEKRFLSIIEQYGKRSKRVTPHGTALGLREEEREGQYGRYVAISYSKGAQQFILDNLEAILAEAAAD